MVTEHGLLTMPLSFALAEAQSHCCHLPALRARSLSPGALFRTKRRG